MDKKPIIQCILDNLVEGDCLPIGYRLPSDGEVAPEMQFLDGAEDGVRLYHMPAKQVDLIPYTSVIYLVKSGRTDKAMRDLRRAIRDNKKQFVRMIDVVGALQEWMQKHPNVMQDERILQFALQIIMTSSEREEIKFALAVLSIYGLDEKGQIPRMVRVLALSDEFTFQCVTMMKNWKNPNEEIFEIARRVRGWGKIHAVHYLEPETDKIRQWMITDGCKNDVHPGYSARDLAVKLSLVKILTDPALTDEQLQGISVIMDALMDDTPIPGISSIREKDILMDVYLQAAQGRQLNREGVSAVSKIRGRKDA